MKNLITKILIIFLIFYLFNNVYFTNILLAQEQVKVSCEVKKTEISEFYQGECKRGRAHGKGIAKGIDEYEGEFKRGLPHGEGVYKWSNGDKYIGDFKRGLPHGSGKYIWSNGDIYEGEWMFGVKNGYGNLTYANGEVKSGTWYKDQFKSQNETIQNKYKILSRRNVKNIKITQKASADSPHIQITFRRGGRVYHEMDNLMIAGSSGSLVTSASYTAFESIIFPFEGKIRFTAPNELYTTNFDCEFSFKIIEQGSWLIEILF